MKTPALSLTAFTAVGIFTYWTLVFAKIFPVTELLPGYKNWAMSFPLADGWIAVTSLLAFIFLLRGDDRAVRFARRVRFDLPRLVRAALWNQYGLAFHPDGR